MVGAPTPDAEKESLLETEDNVREEPCKGTEAAAPQEDHRHASAPHAFLNLIKSFVGAGLLALPHAMSEVGWLGGISALATVGIISSFTGRLLIESKRVSNSDTYPQVGYAAAGTPGYVLSFGMLSLQQTMMAASYMMFARPDVLPNPWANIAILCAAVYPLTLIRDMDALYPVSLFGSACLIAGALTVLIGVDWHPPVFFTTFNLGALPLFMGSAIFSMVRRHSPPWSLRRTITPPPLLSAATVRRRERICSSPWREA